MEILVAGERALLEHVLDVQRREVAALLDGLSEDDARARLVPVAAHDRDIAEPAVIAAILADLGQPPARLADAQSPEAKAKLREQTERAQALGIFGAPSLVAGGELFWGNDRVETAIAKARRA